ncbi:flavin monoamine oxidase family protein [Oricola nitratireducens]|uniref:flavin monoamine oxidase family protein n=1 Tax=Oricola nitratireducens TaxID=2775868 RepID=UPI001868EAAF|nr:FAD-dependent oxidoreductase [Oricola nitratireducens]
MSDRYDVIVAGAGFTGLSAASALRDAGLSFCLLEARNRVGGRVEAERNALGELIDTGGQFFCEDMPVVSELAHRYRKSVVEAPVAGRSLVRPPLGTEDAAGDEYWRAVAAIRERLRSTDPDDSSVRDRTVAEWSADLPDPEYAREGFRGLVQGLWCRSADEIPAWHLIECERRITNEEQELQFFLRETMHSLADDIGRDLGDRLRLSMPVSMVRHSDDGVEIEAGTATLRARRLILALPPSRAAKLDFSPALPARLRSALGGWRPGNVIKIFLRFETAFWRDRGLNGTVSWRHPAGLYVCDASHDDRHPGMVMFAGGPLSEEWAQGAEDAIRQRAISALVDVFGEEAASPLDVTVRNWVGDRWSGGAYNDVLLDMEAHDAESVLLDGHGAVIFASSELSPSFPGYIEGAIVAGRNAAREVVGSLARAPGI